MKQKNLLYISISLVFALSIPCIVVGYDALLESGRKAAINELKVYPADNSKVGMGFRLYTIDVEKCLEEPPPQDFDSVIIPSYKYVYLVTNEIDSISILEMYFVDNRWSRGGQGPGIAQVLLNILKTWPSSKGYDYRYIEGRYLHEDLIEIYRKGRLLGIIRLLPSLANSGKIFSSKDLYKPNKLFKELLPVIRREIEIYKRMNKPTR